MATSYTFSGATNQSTKVVKTKDGNVTFELWGKGARVTAAVNGFTIEQGNEETTYPISLVTNWATVEAAIDALKTDTYLGFNAGSGGGGTLPDGTAAGQLAIWDGAAWNPSEILIDEISEPEIELIFIPPGRGLLALGENADGAAYLLNIGTDGRIELEIQALSGNEMGLIAQDLDTTPSFNIYATDAVNSVSSLFQLNTDSASKIMGGSIPYFFRSPEPLNALLSSTQAVGDVQIAGAEIRQVNIKSVTTGAGARPFISIESQEGVNPPVILMSATQLTSDNDTFILPMLPTGTGAINIIVSTQATGYSQYDIVTSVEIIP